MPEVYQELRALLFSIAYRMIGSVGDAEDIVQETFLRYHRAQLDGADIDSPKAFLSAVATRLSIDHLRSARVRRESYVGTWLPEPLLADAAVADPATHAADADSLSMAFLLVLERLTPLERAVFVLHDVFDYGYREIAAIVDKSEANCRQLAARARQHVTEQRPRFETSRQQRDELAARFLAAMGEGDLAGLISLLAADVEVYGDSGGVSPSWPNVIAGREKVARLLLALGEQMRALGVSIALTHVNGQPGAATRDAAGRLVNVFSLDIADGQVCTIRSVINRDKLAHLGPLADLPALLRERNARR
ncbi:MAG TPA: RNA polymerase sigma-70 factor [Jatrophihabitans sp.]|jgi:RNA polymerase sigma-70 factor (ECF subfamily)|nr:RNA polymerase sigma-70 factor [Jatrophihabitans sp.]